MYKTICILKYGTFLAPVAEGGERGGKGRKRRKKELVKEKGKRKIMK